MTASEYRRLILHARKTQLRLTQDHVLRLEAAYEAAAASLRVRLTALASATGDAPLAQAQLEALLAGIDGELSRLRADTFSLLDAGMTDLAQQAATREQLTETLAGATPDTRFAANLSLTRTLSDGSAHTVWFGTLARSAVQATAARVYGDGFQLSDRLHRLDADTRKAIADTLVQGVAEQVSARELGRRLEDVLTRAGTDCPRYRAATIAQTEINNAHREAHYRSTLDADGNKKSFVAGIGWRLSVSHVKPCRCDLQASDDSDGLGAGNYLVENAPTAPHPRCFPAGTVVAAPGVEASITRWYEGEIIEIQTLHGNFLTVTPNHPILTSQGWVAAGLLREGCDVVSCRRAERVAALVNPENYQALALIEDVAETVGGAAGMTARSVPIAAEDLHGDGAGSQVGVIRADRFLGRGHKAAIRQPLPQQELIRGDVGRLPLSGRSDLAAMLEGLGFAAHRSMRRLHIAMVFLLCALGDMKLIGLTDTPDANALFANNRIDRHARTLKTFGERLCRFACKVSIADFLLTPPEMRGSPSRLGGSKCDTCGYEKPLYNAQADSKVSRNRLARLASEVRFDRVVRVRKHEFAGHVYNLQTEPQWYIANNIIAHNCLCFTVTLLTDYPQLQFPGKEPDPDGVPERLRS